MDTSRPHLVVGPVSAAPGTRATGLAPANLGDTSVELPIALVHGARPGPRVAITAGIHGAEYVSIAALREVVLGLDPEDVSGSIVAVLTASPVAFAARTIYVNPLDGRNLNRAFPGDAAGSPTERLAHWLTETVIAGSDAFLDMHCGDMNEALVSFTGIEDTGDPVVDARSRALAEAYGLRYLLIGPSPGTTTTAAAALGIPAVLAEVGGQGRWPADDVALHAAGLRRWLRAAGVIADAPDQPCHATEVLPNEAWMRATTTGYWHPAVAVGQRVEAGAVVGEVQDAFGSVQERPRATIDGVVNFLVTSLAMNSGDPLLALAG
ncbi:MAG TPA: succinylglutamate desuccinylase/aspartoacylase family protein [Candidatus Limnocylindrales bacterium]|nr:succinylglutamate desuccinylase/aspartoacylase family protein [Candidatus Limnocylindrales bacterium]